MTAVVWFFTTIIIVLSPGDHCVAIPAVAFQLGHAISLSNFERRIILSPRRHVVAVSNDFEKILVDSYREKSDHSPLLGWMWSKVHSATWDPKIPGVQANMHLPVSALTFTQLNLRHVISNPASACPFPPA